MTNIITTQGNGFAPATIDEAMRLADTLSRSSMVPRAYQGKPEDILVATIWGKEIGLATLQALQNIAVINGKPSVYGDAAMALVQASAVCEDVQEYFEGEGTPNPIAVCVAKRRGRKEVVAKFSVEDAKRAGLWGKQGPWQAYPKRMMQMRARGFALRDAFPDVLKGLITAEEAQDYPDEAKPRQAKDITPRNPLDVIAPPVSQPISDPVAIAQAMEDTLDVPEPVAMTVDEVAAEVVMPETEVVEIPEAVAQVQHVEDQITDSVTAPAPIGYALLVPGKTEPVSVHDTLDEWQDAYEDMADKVAKAGKRPARERMTILRELKEANEATINRVDMVLRIRHTANYTRRIKALGAAQ
jgi:hypothetical protein